LTDHDPDRCARCNRKLRSPLAQAAGYGPTCGLRALRDRPRRRPPLPDGQLALDEPQEPA
jgi:hypothetical protein